MQNLRRITATGLVASAVLVAFGGTASAGAEEQTVDGTLAGTITITSAPADFTLPALPASGAAAGSISIDANTGYTLSVRSLKATMTQWDAATAAYGTNALSSAMTVTATSTAGSGVGAPATVNTTGAALATNPLSGILTTSDSYDLAITQPATALDPAGTYRHELTYTVSAGV